MSFHDQEFVWLIVVNFEEFLVNFDEFFINTDEFG
jgi:hypothetical protein